MKRKKHGRPTVINWKYCFICQTKQKKDITDSGDFIEADIMVFLTVQPAKLAKIVILPTRTRGLGPSREGDYGY